MDPFGMPISWLPILVVETEGLPPFQTRVVNLVGVPTFFPSRGIFLSVSFHFTTVVSLKTRVPLRTVSVTISFKVIVQNS